MISIFFSLDDKTRVKLERYNFNYINASHVAVPLANRRYILTQASKIK